MNKNISVLISIHFRIPRKNIIDCLNSLINQSLRPSEIIIVKDGVLNFSLEKICDSMDFDNFKIITLDINNGLANALNEGLKHCSFELVARMDSDDICHSNRLEKQAYFMEINPEVVVSSGAVDEYDENMESLIFTKKVPIKNSDILKFSKRRNPINHPATIFRKSIIESVGGYPLLQKGQDYALWSLLLVKDYKLGNLEDSLVKIRTGNDFYKRRGLEFFKFEIKLLKYQKEIGFLSSIDFLLNFLIRFITRLVGRNIKHIIYSSIRRLDNLK